MSDRGLLTGCQVSLVCKTLKGLYRETIEVDCDTVYVFESLHLNIYICRLICSAREFLCNMLVDLLPLKTNLKLSSDNNQYNNLK